MATFSVNDSNRSWDIADFQSFQIRNARTVYASNSSIVLSGQTDQSETLRVTYTGSWYTFGTSVYGTIRTISFEIDGKTVFSASGMSVPFSTYTSSSSTTFTASATKGDDLFVANSSVGSYWSAGAGDDTINGGTGNDNIYGGSGVDRVILDTNFAEASFSRTYTAVDIRSSDGLDKVTDIELLQFNDGLYAFAAESNYTSSVITGNQQSETSNDLMFGGRGNDTMSGKSGKDWLWSGLGDDSLNGGGGGDKLYGEGGDDTLLGGGGRDKLYGGSGSDKLSGNNGNDKLFGGSGNDNLSGGNGFDKLFGGWGADVLLGDKGNDVLNGHSGHDDLSGGAGQDTLIGGKGNDVLSGGDGADVFKFSSGHGKDTVLDFTVGTDLIEITNGASGLDDLSLQMAGDDVLISFANVTILVEDTTVDQLQDADNFLF